MDFEVFTGERRKRYYVFQEKRKEDYVNDILCPLTKEKKGSYKIIPVWVRRNVEENGEFWDFLWTEKVKDSVKMYAAVKR